MSEIVETSSRFFAAFLDIVSPGHDKAPLSVFLPTFLWIRNMRRFPKESFEMRLDFSCFDNFFVSPTAKARSKSPESFTSWKV